MSTQSKSALLPLVSSQTAGPSKRKKPFRKRPGWETIYQLRASLARLELLPNASCRRSGGHVWAETSPNPTILAASSRALNTISMP